MTINEWIKKHGNKRRPGMHGIYDSYDMEDRIVVREVYIKGWRVMTLAPIWPDEDEIENNKTREGA